MSSDGDRALTEEEHHARAMLLGMRYHHGNGDPVYYKEDGGIPMASSFIDANTLETLFMLQGQTPMPFLMPKARTAWNMMIDERVAARAARVLARERANKT